MATSGVTVSLKLLIDTKSKRLLFAEAGEDFVTFLYSLLCLPAGTVFKLLNERPLLKNILNYGEIECRSLCQFDVKFSIKDPTCVYMVMEDLTAAGPLEERVVHLGLDEGLKLLKATLQTNMVLTSIFLGGTGTNDA
ncbi:hypothetical protein Vadar_021936 [Vaccinium darrowii]|uniref:Uncharacterized protein n=1 Tax=Vaccinium darrowii TaxID=229202 RepID=A0ACB7XJI4_9ERIC|nr:hypothetical protein Vadar_021936 [Vaccinium darrowii]